MYTIKRTTNYTMMSTLNFNTGRKQRKHSGQVYDVLIGRVYIISNIIDDKIYIGSTTETLIKRFGNHITALNKGVKSDLYDHMRINGQDKYKIVLQEYKEVENKKELDALEQKYINKYNPEILLNMKRANIND